MSERILVAGGNCGCGQMSGAACWEAFACGCEYDHGDFRPCDLHEAEAELERQSQEMQSRFDAASDWARDEAALGGSDAVQP